MQLSDFTTYSIASENLQEKNFLSFFLKGLSRFKKALIQFVSKISGLSFGQKATFKQTITFDFGPLSEAAQERWPSKSTGDLAEFVSVKYMKSLVEGKFNSLQISINGTKITGDQELDSQIAYWKGKVREKVKDNNYYNEVIKTTENSGKIIGKMLSEDSLLKVKDPQTFDVVIRMVGNEEAGRSKADVIVDFTRIGEKEITDSLNASLKVSGKLKEVEAYAGTQASIWAITFALLFGKQTKAAGVSGAKVVEIVSKEMKKMGVSTKSFEDIIDKFWNMKKDDVAKAELGMTRGQHTVMQPQLYASIFDALIEDVNNLLNTLWKTDRKRLVDGIRTLTGHGHDDIYAVNSDGTRVSYFSTTTSAEFKKHTEILLNKYFEKNFQFKSTITRGKIKGTDVTRNTGINVQFIFEGKIVHQSKMWIDTNNFRTSTPLLKAYAQGQGLSKQKVEDVLEN